MSNPLVSICIPNYNYAKFLSCAIESILDQTLNDYELLIIDDCSEDGSRKLLEDYAKRDHRIRTLFNKRNLGMVENWNSCLLQARGKYIKYLFADDFLTQKDSLQKLIEPLESSSPVSLVASSRKIINSVNETIGWIAPFKEDFVSPGTHAINLCLALQDNLIGEPSAVVFRKSDAERGFNLRYRQIVDLEMWFYLLEKGNLAYIREPLNASRIHASRQTFANRVDPLKTLNDLFLLNEEYLTKPYVNLSKTSKAFVHYDHAYRIWKIYRTGQIDRQTAINEIDSRYNYQRFRLFFTVYKAFKPFRKLYHWILKKRVHSGEQYSLSSSQISDGRT